MQKPFLSYLNKMDGVTERYDCMLRDMLINVNKILKLK